jgi:hypothetical protein
MKTLGEIAYDTWSTSKYYHWADEQHFTRRQWEAAAQAVRAAVIEECAKVCEERYTDDGRNDSILFPVYDESRACAYEIRALKDKP